MSEVAASGYARMSPAAVARVVERNVIVYSKLWHGSIFTAFIAPLLFLGAMGIGLGELVDANVGDVGGLTYLQFVAPALMVATGAQMAAAESLWPVMAGWRWIRHYHGMVATPVGPADVYGGFVVWTVMRVLLAGTIFIAVASVLGGVTSPWAVLAIPASGLCAAAFCSLIGAWSMTQENDSLFSALIRLGIMPLMLFSGTFFPVEQMPGWLQPAVWLSPMWHGVELARAATTGTFAPRLIANVAVLVACVVVGAVWGSRTFTRRLTS